MADTITVTNVSYTITVTEGTNQTIAVTPAPTQTISLTTTQGTANLTGLTTDNLGEGSSNLYFTNARASAAAPVQSVIAATGIADAGVSLTTNGSGVASITNTKLGTMTNVTMPSGYAVGTISGAGVIAITYSNTATIRSGLGAAAASHTHAHSYNGQIETAANKTYTLDARAVSARTITGFFIKCGSGTVTATLKRGSDVVKAASVSTSSGDQTSLANTSVNSGSVISLVLSSNSSATDVIYSVDYTA